MDDEAREYLAMATGMGQAMGEELEAALRRWRERSMEPRMRMLDEVAPFGVKPYVCVPVGAFLRKLADEIEAGAAAAGLAAPGGSGSHHARCRSAGCCCLGLDLVGELAQER